MKAIEIEVLNQIISRTDKTGNEKVEMLMGFISKYIQSEQVINNNIIEVKKLSELLADFEKTASDTERDLSEVKATMIVNFNGSRENSLPKLLDGTENTALQMLIKILDYYVNNQKPEPPSELSKKIEQIKKELNDNKIRPLNPIWVRDEILSKLKEK